MIFTFYRRGYLDGNKFTQNIFFHTPVFQSGDRRPFQRMVKRATFAAQLKRGRAGLPLPDH